MYKSSSAKIKEIRETPLGIKEGYAFSWNADDDEVFQATLEWIKKAVPGTSRRWWKERKEWWIEKEIGDTLLPVMFENGASKLEILHTQMRMF